MARPRKIAPNGEVVRVTVTLSELTRRKYERQAKREGVTLSEVVRRALESNAA
jgi:hypothetical protein